MFVSREIRSVQDDLLARRQADALYVSSTVSGFMTLGAALIYLWAMQGPAQGAALEFLAISCLLLLYRVAILVARTHAAAPSSRFWSGLALAGFGLSGIAWGGMNYAAVRVGSDAQVLISICLAMGAVIVNVLNITAPWAIYSFSFPMFGLAATAYLTSDRPGHLAVGVLALIFCPVMFLAARRLSGKVLTSMRLELENGALVRSLEHQAQALESANAELGRLARTDPLTGLGNRRLFQDGLEAAWAAGRDGDTLLLVIDIDHFKAFNDSFGHDAGDRCLRYLGTVLTSVSRRGKDIVTRQGGEEFAIIMQDAGIDQARAMAEAIRDRLAQAQHGPDFALPRPITVSIGIARRVPEGQDSMDALIRRADEALYRAKALGRDRACVAWAELGDDAPRVQAIGLKGTSAS